MTKKITIGRKLGEEGRIKCRATVISPGRENPFHFGVGKHRIPAVVTQKEAQGGKEATTPTSRGSLRSVWGVKGKVTATRTCMEKYLGEKGIEIESWSRLKLGGVHIPVDY